MSKEQILILAAMLLCLLMQPALWAEPLFISPQDAVSLHVFESQSCAICQEMNPALEALQNKVGSDRLRIIHHVVEDPSAQDAFIQNQVTVLPEYVLMNGNQEMLFQMKGMIEPDRLVWEIQEGLKANLAFTIPKALVDRNQDFSQIEGPTVILFLPDQTISSQDYIDTAIASADQILGETPNILTFSSVDPIVQAWMTQLGFDKAPAYVLVTPQKTVFVKSEPGVTPNHLVADLNAYARQFNSELQTILVGLTEPVPVDDAIHPATMTPETQPASDGMFLHE